ncbi:MAG: 50S ribosomal protein L30 [Eubacteriales bacterium]|nr:50S ribosomal protein L30 [Eubacteriales bacterium]
MPENTKKAADKMLKITLVKSKIGAVPKNRKIVESMGFTKLNSSVIKPDNASTRGQIRLIAHMVKVEELN